MVCVEESHDFEKVPGIVADKYVCRQCEWERSDLNYFGEIAKYAASAALPILFYIGGAAIFDHLSQANHGNIATGQQ
jgi:hypothetical protein